MFLIDYESCKKFISAQKKILDHESVIVQPFIQKIFIKFLGFQISIIQVGCK